MSIKHFFIRLAGTALLLATVTVTGYAHKTNATVRLQRVVDTTGLGVTGKITLTKRGSTQLFQVVVHDLPGESFGVFYGTSFTTGVATGTLIATMSRGGTNDTWRLTLTGTGEAPPRLYIPPDYPVTDLDDLAGLAIYIGKPNPDDTNTVDAVLSAVVPSLASPDPSFKLRAPLVQPPIPPSTTPKGFVRTQYNAKQGWSVFDVRAQNLPGGNEWKLQIEDPIGSTNFVDLGEVTMSPSTKSLRFSRNTKHGERLPLNSATAANLSGRILLLRDAFDDIHLYGVVP